MNFETIRKELDWIEFLSQNDRDVTYVFVLNRTIGRLSGASDILYIGETKQPIRERHKQETRTNNTQGNTQQTNIRTTHVFQQLGSTNIKCYYTRALNCTLSGDEMIRFLNKCRTWDKKFCLKLEKQRSNQNLEVPLEKYLLVRYAEEHLEVPPMNNRL